MMKNFLIAIILTIFFTPFVNAQRNLTDATKVVTIEGKKQGKSRGLDPNINPDRQDFCITINQMNEDTEFDMNACVRIENTTKNTIQVYMDGDFFSVVPPYGLLDALPLLSTTTIAFYAVAQLEDDKRMTWGPWEHFPNSCLLMQLK